MAQGGSTNINVIDTILVKRIFETMEYPVVWERTNLAESWLKSKQKIAVYIGKNTSEGKPLEIGDINYTDKPIATIYKGSERITEKIIKKDSLITVYSPKDEDVEKVIVESVENEQWFNTDNLKKAFLIERLAKEIKKRSDLICQLEILVRGILKNDTNIKAVPLLVEYLQYYASWAIKHSKENVDWKSKKVTASIISDNSFLAIFGFILGPALAAGYNIILQTEPKISIIASLIVELAEEVGIPKGTIKVLPGKDLNLSQLFKHPHLQVISRFGDLNGISKDNLSIEVPLGKNFLTVINSKSSMIVFNNADLDSACTSAIDACWGYQGMLPWSINTVLIQEDIFESFVKKLKNKLSTIKMGFACDQSADISYPQLLNLKKQCIVKDLEMYVNMAKANGIEVFQAKNEKIEAAEPFYPTILIGGKLFNVSHVITEDDDLPVLTAVAFRSTNEGINLANNTRFGFGASVWTANISLANEVIGKLHVANVWINNHGHFTAATPFTSYKQSGMGHFGGEEGFLEYVIINTFSMPFYTKDSTEEPQTIKPNLDGIITVAKKGQEEWSKMTCLIRSQLLRKASDEINSKSDILSQMLKVPKTLLIDWITATYEASAQINNNLGSISIQKPYELKSFKEPVGILVIEDDSLQFLEVIVGALLLGNSVIILNLNPNNSKFLEEISGKLLACGVPKGVFNIISNCDEDVFDDFKAYKEITSYFTTFHEPLNKLKLEDYKCIHAKGESWSRIVKATTKTKNVWSDIGDSVL